MSGFKALNIESDDESDIEVDDTKEIQIEDALKLYQNALRYHAEGPSSYDFAEEAYKKLFESEIFQYPESVTELKRIELYGAVNYDVIYNEHGGAELTTTSNVDAAHSTLPQIIHLSHKNYAQFKLDALAARLDALQASFEDVLTSASQALDNFVSALDKDESDLDLWRQTAQVSEIIDSKRLTRFCLESILDGEDEGLNSVLSLPGLENGIAAQRRRILITELSDNLSLLQTPLSPEQRRVLSRHLKQRLDPLDDLTARANSLASPTDSAHGPTVKNLDKVKTWTAIGTVILKEAESEQESKLKQQGPVFYNFASTNDDHQNDTVPATIAAKGSSTVALTGEKVESDAMLLDSAAATAPLNGSDESKVLKTEVDVHPVATRDDTTEKATMTLPTRKRSGDSAGINDAQEEVRSRSKRIRARESIPDSIEARQALHDANIQWEYDQHLNEIQGADDWLFETVGLLFDRIGVACIETIKDVKAQLTNDLTSQVTSSISTAQEEFFSFLNNYSDSTAQSFLRSGHDWQLNFSNSANDSSLAIANEGATQSKNFELMPQTGVEAFLQATTLERMTLGELAIDFVQAMFFPSSSTEIEHSLAAYETYLWPEELKTVVVRTLITFDGILLEHARESWSSLYKEHMISADSPERMLGSFGLRSQHFRRYLQNVFEIHLDIFCVIRPKNSGVDAETVTLQDERLQRWFELTREVTWSSRQYIAVDDSLDLRFLWATTCFMAVQEDTSRNRTLAYMQDLRSHFEDNHESIELRNNAVMPELSLAALDREIAKLTTKDFFDKIAEMPADDMQLLETLEPLLESLYSRSNLVQESPVDDSAGLSVATDLIEFLENEDFDTVMKLWKRLLDAYTAIGYGPMALRVLYRMTGLVLQKLDDEQFSQVVDTERPSTILVVLRALDKLVVQLYERSQEDNALDCMGEEDLQSAVQILSKALRLLQTLNIFEDPIRIGKNQAPLPTNGSASSTFSKFCEALHDMQLRMWIMLYKVLLTAMTYYEDLFPASLEDRFDFLRTLHRNLGIRGICGGLDGAFIRLLSTEFFKMTHIESYDSEQAQVLYDLYDLNCFLNPSYELMEHHCKLNFTLDRAVAMQSVDLLLIQAKKLPIKELIKHSMKDAIDQIHESLARKKPTEAILKNREVIRAFLRSPIRPTDMYQCLKGEGNQLEVLQIPESDAILAAKGWYFLMGHIALTKFRSVKRTGQSPTEDVDIAIAFFMQDLEFSTTNWETWFRLAQAYDTKIEESVVWSAEKLNNSMDDIIQLQRAAIHCFTMATALAHRSADPGLETNGKLAELYAEFAMRLYSSSREPFGMKPFAQDLCEKPLSKQSGMAKGKAFQPLQTYTCWKLAKVFFQKAIQLNPQQWTLHYMLGKCLWKMHNSPEQPLRPSVQAVLDVLRVTINLVPGKKELSNTKRDPILEPHYKLISVVNKLVSGDRLSLEDAEKALQHTHFSNGVDFPQTRSTWTSYMLSLVKNLRTADKSNWHHRFVARAAILLFRDSGDLDGIGRATAAKHELTQQMFTKTMSLQVWRPEAERPGRHFVYTARYTLFFVEILQLLKDRVGLEMLAKRLRKRQHDTFDNMTTWSSIVLALLKLLREHAAVQEGLELRTFSTLTQEDFLTRKELLEQWMQVQEPGTNDTLDVLRETQELKKINQGLMKPAEIDDLIGDAYATLFNTVAKQLSTEQDSRVKQDELSKAATTAPPTPPPVQKNPMSLAHLMNVDGTSSEQEVDKKAQATPEAEATAPTKKKVGIGRREIRIAAEACMQKTGTTVSVNGNKTNTVPEVSRIAELVKSQSNGANGDAGANTSAPASLHDDADDESSLSEFEDAPEEIVADEDDEMTGLADTNVDNPFTSTRKADEHDDREIEDSDPADEGGNGDRKTADVAIPLVDEEGAKDEST